MEPIIVKKAELKEKLVANREGHRKIFDEAVEGYKREGVRLLEEHIEQVKRGSLTRVYVVLPVPENHMKDYDRVIAMLDMSIDDAIELSESDFSRYVMDEWEWRDAFLTTNSAYSATAKKLSG